MEKKLYIFSDISYEILKKKILNIVQVRNENIFHDWFNFDYKIDKSNEKFLTNLIVNNKYNIDFYSEFQLQLYFIIPLLHKIYFYGNNYREWFQEEISAVINNNKLKGVLDFMVASGTDEPEKPYFFIQEFKKSAPIPKHPRGQLLAQMACAIEKNKTINMRGAYNIGKYWNFVVLEKISPSKYQYHESESFDVLKINDLKKIFKILKAVKHKYCK